MNQANPGKKPLFTDEQIIPAAAAAKKFGAMSDRAQSIPLFVTGKQAGGSELSLVKDLV